MGAFPIGEFTFESLAKVSHTCQAAIVVLTPDDEVTKKGAPAFVARDNALFEAGLFLSAFGRHRVAIARSKAVSVLSDIHGIVGSPVSDTVDNGLSRNGGAYVCFPGRYPPR
jgi:predicted nucleotide-binding protein